MLPKEEFAFDMGRNEIDYAATRVAQSMPTKQDCALGMEQSANYAAAIGARILSSKEECALGMGQRSNGAAAMGVQTWLKLEESVLSTGQSSIVNNAAARDVKIKFTAEEYASDTGRRRNKRCAPVKEVLIITIQMTNLQHLLNHVDQHMTKLLLLLFPISIQHQSPSLKKIVDILLRKLCAKLPIMLRYEQGWQ